MHSQKWIYLFNFISYQVNCLECTPTCTSCLNTLKKVLFCSLKLGNNLNDFWLMAFSLDARIEEIEKKIKHEKKKIRRMNSQRGNSLESPS